MVDKIENICGFMDLSTPPLGKGDRGGVELKI